MFEIKADNLRRQSEIKNLKLSDGSYDVTFFYYGEYAEDMELKGVCDAEKLSMSCKGKGAVLPLALVSGKLFIETEDIGLLRLEGVAEYQKQLEEAYASACELAKILKQYFGLDAVSV